MQRDVEKEVPLEKKNDYYSCTFIYRRILFYIYRESLSVKRRHKSR